MSDSQAGPSIIEIFAGTLGIILSAVCIVGFFVAGFAIDYIDERIEDDCDSTTGQLEVAAKVVMLLFLLLTLLGLWYAFRKEDVIWI